MLQEDVACSNRWSEVNQLYIENERGSRRDHRRMTCLSVSVLIWSDDLCLLSSLHRSERFVPCLDNLANSDLALEGAAFLNTRVKHTSVLECAVVVSGDIRAGRADRS